MRALRVVPLRGLRVLTALALCACHARAPAPTPAPRVAVSLRVDSATVSRALTGPIADVAMGGRDVYARLRDGTVVHWPAAGATGRWVRSLTGATQLAAGGAHACARMADGTALCWGANDRGQLGRGSHDDTLHRLPAPVTGLADVAEIAAGDFATCARSHDGAVRCWGTRDGLTEGDFVSAPALIAGLTSVRQLALRAGGACAVLADGTVRCWSVSANGTAFTHGPTPTAVDGVAGALRVGVGEEHACAALADGTVRCWGGGFGPMAVAIPGVVDALDVTCADGTAQVDEVTAFRGWSCAVLRSGGRTCWWNRAPVATDAGGAFLVATLTPAEGASGVVLAGRDDGVSVCRWNDAARVMCQGVDAPDAARAALELPPETAPTDEDAPRFPAWSPPAEGAAGDEAFRAFTRGYARALGDWTVGAWGTTTLDPAAPSRVATVCSPSVFHAGASASVESALLIEYQHQAWLFRWSTALTFPDNDPCDVDAEAQRIASPPPWTSREEHVLEAHWRVSGENDVERVGVRGGRLLWLESLRRAGWTHGGNARTPRGVPVAPALDAHGMPPDPVDQDS